MAQIQPNNVASLQAAIEAKKKALEAKSGAQLASEQATKAGTSVETLAKARNMTVDQYNQMMSGFSSTEKAQRTEAISAESAKAGDAFAQVYNAKEYATDEQKALAQAVNDKYGLGLGTIENSTYQGTDRAIQEGNLLAQADGVDEKLRRDQVLANALGTSPSVVNKMTDDEFNEAYQNLVNKKVEENQSGYAGVANDGEVIDNPNAIIDFKSLINDPRNTTTTGNTPDFKSLISDPNNTTITGTDYTTKQPDAKTQTGPVDTSLESVVNNNEQAKTQMNELAELIKQQQAARTDSERAAIEANLQATLTALEKTYNQAVSEQESLKGDVASQYGENIEDINEATYLANEFSKVSAEQRGIGNSAQLNALQRGTLSRASKAKLDAAVERDGALNDISERISNLTFNKGLDEASATSQAELAKVQSESNIASESFGQLLGLLQSDYEFERGAEFEKELLRLQQDFTTSERESSQDFEVKMQELQQAFSTSERVDTQEFQEKLQDIQNKYTTEERLSSQDFKKEILDLEQEFITAEREAGQDFDATQQQAQFDWQSAENQANRDWNTTENDKDRSLQAWLQEIGFEHDILMFEKDSALRTQLQAMSDANAMQRINASTAAEKQLIAYNNALKVANEVKKYTPGTDEYKAMMGALNVERGLLREQAESDYRYAEKYADLELEIAKSEYEQSIENQLNAFTPGTMEYEIQQRALNYQMDEALMEIGVQSALDTTLDYIQSNSTAPNDNVFKEIRSGYLTSIIEFGPDPFGLKEDAKGWMTDNGFILSSDSYNAQKSLFDNLLEIGGITQDNYDKVIDLIPRY